MAAIPNGVELPSQVASFFNPARAAATSDTSSAATVRLVVPCVGGIPAKANLLPSQGSTSLSNDTRLQPDASSAFSKIVRRTSALASVTPETPVNAGKCVRKRSAATFC